MKRSIPSQGEFLESDSRGFRTNWLVDADYRIEDGIIRPLVDGRPVDVLDRFHNADSLSRYLPMIRTELPFEFAKLADGSEDTILPFFRRYGLLGYREALLSSLSVYKSFEFALTMREEKEGQPPDPIRDFSEFYHPRVNDGESLAWVIAHAKTVKFVLELNDALQDKQRLKTRLDELTVYREQHGDRLVAYQYACRGELYPREASSARLGEPDLEFALRIIRHIVNANLDGGVSRELITGLEPEERTNRQQHRRNVLIAVFQAKSLIDCIYWHLADAIAGSTIKRCLFCKRFFNATHLKRLYCPPPMGLRGEGSCAQNDRAKRLRQAKKKGNSGGRIRPRKTKG